VKRRVEPLTTTTEGRQQRVGCYGALRCLYSCSSEMRTKREAEKQRNKNRYHRIPRPDLVQRVVGWQRRV
jgi:hypothetical protein